MKNVLKWIKVETNKGYGGQTNFLIIQTPPESIMEDKVMT
jgi:hypothetical protein